MEKDFKKYLGKELGIPVDPNRISISGNRIANDMFSLRHLLLRHGIDKIESLIRKYYRDNGYVLDFFVEDGVGNENLMNSRGYFFTNGKNRRAVNTIFSIDGKSSYADILFYDLTKIQEVKNE